MPGCHHVALLLTASAVPEAPAPAVLSWYAHISDGGCKKACENQGLTPVNGGTGGQALCRVTYNGQTVFGTKDTSPKCIFTAYPSIPDSRNLFDCGCVAAADVDAERFTWQPTAVCSSSVSAAGDGAPPVCRISDPVSGNYSMGWLGGLATCYFASRPWGLGGSTLNTVSPAGQPPYNNSILCYSREPWA